MDKAKQKVQLPEHDVEVVLGAGGVKGIAHIGLLRCLEERKVKIGRITGASAGSLIAAFYTNGYKSKELEEIFLDEEFRFPDWGVWAECLHLADPWNFWNRLMVGGFPGMLDFGPWLRHIIRKYNLKPQPNLRIIATDAFTRKPVIFEGTDYDLATALQATSAVVTGLWMQPAWLPAGSPHSHAHGEECDMPFGHYLIDGFYYHPEPANLCDAPAIVSKVGLATRPPTERLPVGDMALHYREMMIAPVMQNSYPDEPGHLTVEVGLPDVASLTFGISQKKLRQILDHAYCQACRRLNDQTSTKFLSEHKCCSECGCE